MYDDCFVVFLAVFARDLILLLIGQGTLFPTELESLLGIVEGHKNVLVVVMAFVAIISSGRMWQR